MIPRLASAIAITRKNVRTRASLQHKVSCSPAEVEAEREKAAAAADGSYDFVCDIGNPLPANERADFGVKLIGSNVDPTRESVEVRMSANSTNPEEAGATRDNDLVVRVGVEVKAQLGLSGRSNPEVKTIFVFESKIMLLLRLQQLDFSIRNRTRGEAAVFDFEAGPVVSHLYQARLEIVCSSLKRPFLGYKSWTQRHQRRYSRHLLAEFRR